MAKDKKALHDEYMRERRRIQSFIRKAKKRGFVFEDGILPKIPKKITEASINVLKKLTPKELYEKAKVYKVDLETGEATELTGSQRRQEERIEAAEKAKETRARKNITHGTKKLHVETPEAGDINEEYTVSVSSEEDKEYTSSYESVDYEEEPTKESEKDEDKEKEENEKESDDDIFSIPDFGIEETTPSPADFSYSTTDRFEYDEEDDEIRPTESSVSLDNLREMIENWEPSPNWTPGLTAAKEGDAQTARDILENAIDELGEEAIIENMKKHGDALQDLLESILYDSGSKEGNFKDGRTQVNANVQFFQSMLYDRPLTPDEAKAVSDIIEANHYAE